VGTNKLGEKVASLNQLAKKAEEADLSVAENLRRIALEIFEEIYQEEEYVESQAELIPLTAELISSILSHKSDFAKRYATSLRRMRRESEAKLKNIKEQAEKAILNMKPAKLYAFFKNPNRLLKQLTK